VFLEVLISGASIAKMLTREEIHRKTVVAICHLLGQFGFQKHLSLLTVMQLHQKIFET